MDSLKPEQGQETKELKKITPRDLIHKHIQDKNHVVTEDELQQLEVGVAEAQVESETSDRTNEIEEFSKKDELPNPYTVLK